MGGAVLGLPARLRWVARHEAGEYDPPRRFVDRITTGGPASVPVSAVLSWRHTHEFEVVDPAHTRIVDRVQTWVPTAMLRPMFAYRYRQLEADLAAHARAADHGLGAITVAVTGASGLIGSALAAFLSSGGHTVIRLVRGEARERGERRWDPADPAADLLDGVDAVVHLAGAPIAGRFTDEHKKAVAGSRISPTRKLAELSAKVGVAVFVSAYIGPCHAAANGPHCARAGPLRAARPFGCPRTRYRQSASRAGSAQPCRPRIPRPRSGIGAAPRSRPHLRVVTVARRRLIVATHSASPGAGQCPPIVQ